MTRQEAIAKLEDLCQTAIDGGAEALDALFPYPGPEIYQDGEPHASSREGILIYLPMSGRDDVMVCCSYYEDEDENGDVDLYDITPSLFEAASETVWAWVDAQIAATYSDEDDE